MIWWPTAAAEPFTAVTVIASPSLSVSLASTPNAGLVWSIGEDSMVSAVSLLATAGRSMVKLSVSLVEPPWPSLTVSVIVSIGCEPVAAPSIAAVLSAV